MDTGPYATCSPTLSAILPKSHRHGPHHVAVGLLWYLLEHPEAFGDERWQLAKGAVLDDDDDDVRECGRELNEMELDRLAVIERVEWRLAIRGVGEGLVYMHVSGTGYGEVGGGVTDVLSYGSVVWIEEAVSREKRVARVLEGYLAGRRLSMLW